MPVYLPTYLTAYAHPSEGHIRVKSSMDTLSPIQHISSFGPLNCQVAVTVDQPHGELGATCSLEPGSVPQVCIAELWSVGSQRGGGGVTGSRSQSTASNPENFNLQLPKFSGFHSKRYEVAFCNISISSSYQEDLHPQGALEPRHLLLPELSWGLSNHQALLTGFVVFRKLQLSGFLCRQLPLPFMVSSCHTSTHTGNLSFSYTYLDT